MSAATQMFGALDGATEAALRASIERFGVLVPVVRDQEGRILDGHHRVRLAEEIGVEYEVRVREVADEAEAREIERTLNTDRRHLTVEQRREVVAALREEGHSIRAIAGALRVSKGAIQYDLGQKPAPDVRTSTPDQTTGLDGKTYPAKQPKSKPPTNGRRGSRKDRDAPFIPVSERHQQLARGQKARLADGLSEITGLCRGLNDLDLRMAAAACTYEELETWAKRARDLAVDLGQLSKTLAEVRRDVA